MTGKSNRERRYSRRKEKSGYTASAVKKREVNSMLGSRLGEKDDLNNSWESARDHAVQHDLSNQLPTINKKRG